MNSTRNDDPVLRTLKDVFGFDTFRDNQEPIVRALLAKQDVLAVMPTGSGKSLCYQLPAVMADGVCVVVSPLIALMKDQVDGAKENGVHALSLNSVSPYSERLAVERGLKDRSLDLLYLAPERLALEGFMDSLKTNAVAMFAIDEAHCISEWGHDFRPDYLVLSQLKKNFPNTPVAAFTASARPKIRDDIACRLNLANPLRVQASFNRPNLYYEIHTKGDWRSSILDFVLSRPGEAGIVYRASRKSVDETAEFLKDNDVSALPYHAGMDSAQRLHNQEAFDRDEIQVIVATIAFGMGIDKSNIRYVVHGDLPRNIESYYQETGRAGRDGDPAHCLMLHSPGDAAIQQHFIRQVEDNEERARRYDQLNAVTRLAETPQCRRKAILSYFGERYTHKNCGTCDVCAGAPHIADETTNARIIMSAIARANEQASARQVSAIVRGDPIPEILRHGYETLKTFGAGRHLSHAECLSVIEHLADAHALSRAAGADSPLSLTSKGRDILFGRRPFKIFKTQPQVKPKPKRQSLVHAQTKLADKQTATPQPANIPEPSQPPQNIFETLKQLRKSIADDQDVAPYVVFSDRVLREIARLLPQSSDELLGIPGVGKQKLMKYGPVFLDAVHTFKDSNDPF